MGNDKIKVEIKSGRRLWNKVKKILLRMVSLMSALTVIVSGCSVFKSGDEKITTVKWYINTGVGGKDRQAVFEKANEILEKRYNLRLEIIGLNSDIYTSKMNILSSGNGEYDLCYTSHWNNSYVSNVSSGTFYELTEEELMKYAPKTYASMSETIWEAAKIDGKIYAVPNWQMLTRSTAIYIPKKLLEMTNTDISNITDYDDMTEYLRKVVKISPDSNDVGAMWNQLMTYNNFIEVFEEEMPGAINFMEGGKPRVFNQYDTQEFEDYINLRRSWCQEGLCDDKYVSGLGANERVPLLIHQASPLGEATQSKQIEREVVGKQISNAVLSTNGVTAAMTAVNATSKNPIAAIRMIEVMNTDSEVMNLLAYGIEGIHYEKISDNQIKKKTNSSIYSGVKLYTLGSLANAYILDTQPKTLIEDVVKFNENAIISPIMGFNPVLDGIEQEIADCRIVKDEYFELLDLGIGDEDDLEKFRADLKKAGVETIIAEFQRQIDEWYKTR